ncbi:cytochrome b5-like heme/steroid binding domain-containing protein [Zychaea mexicana]|uniref:cytochrome b5-like heme/steroid binding domain-containing protein n=1 Tax=Zychaea mexicana TaxID=64656 RepID=UPI0022FE0DFF|nr:cytochrome b5-like heme/steroid binding domain-containing protein [Zychaea mexicana]KAI9491221.1 cytochrome b5-like heme/steroid binding domain-containing protein [Zychaea mexicana]
MSNLQQRRKPQTDEPTSKPASDQAEKDDSKTLKQQQRSSSVLSNILMGLVWIVILFFGASYLITESWTWGYRGKWTNINTYIPRKELVFSEEQLARYDGSNPNLPIYLAVDGDVFDVSAGLGWYGYGGSYNHFAGRDAARAYVTGCFKEHLTHDLRGFSEAQLKGVQGWKSFYENHHTYYKVGRVLHAPIDPDTPIPPPCKQNTPQKP